MVVELVVAVLSAGAVYAMAAARVVRQYERGLVFRLGRLKQHVKEPGFTMIIPAVERLQKVNMQIVTLPVPAQEGITRDNVTVRVDAVVYFRVVDPAQAIVRVEDYRFAVAQMAQTSLRSIIGKSELDDLLSNREKLNQGLELMIDSPAVDWGVTVDRVEIKDVSLPETMKRSMARQAEAHRDRRARLINADAELMASQKLAQAAERMSASPAALQLRLLQTVASVATEKNSTLVLPFPVELLRFLEGKQDGGGTAQADTARPAQAPASVPVPVDEVLPGVDEELPDEVLKELNVGMETRADGGVLDDVPGDVPDVPDIPDVPDAPDTPDVPGDGFAVDEGAPPESGAAGESGSPSDSER